MHNKVIWSNNFAIEVREWRNAFPPTWHCVDINFQLETILDITNCNVWNRFEYQIAQKLYTCNMFIQISYRN